MKYDGICEINEGVSKTSQVYVSNYGLIKSMLNSPRIRFGMYSEKEVLYDDTMADFENKCSDGSVYNQGLDDVSFNIQQPRENIQNIKTNDFSEKSAVVNEEPIKSAEPIKVAEPVKVEEGINNG